LDHTIFTTAECCNGNFPTTCTFRDQPHPSTASPPFTMPYWRYRGYFAPTCTQQFTFCYSTTSQRSPRHTPHSFITRDELFYSLLLPIGALFFYQPTGHTCWQSPVNFWTQRFCFSAAKLFAISPTLISFTKSQSAWQVLWLQNLPQRERILTSLSIILRCVIPVVLVQ